MGPSDIELGTMAASRIAMTPQLGLPPRRVVSERVPWIMLAAARSSWRSNFCLLAAAGANRTRIIRLRSEEDCRRGKKREGATVQRKQCFVP
jgi:hypothetical protein